MPVLELSLTWGGELSGRRSLDRYFHRLPLRIMHQEVMMNRVSTQSSSVYRFNLYKLIHSQSHPRTALHHNRSAYQRIRFRPRVLRKVSKIDTSTTILGVESSLPIFIAPAAMAKLGHPLVSEDGEGYADLVMRLMPGDNILRVK